ncbi:MAG: DMT family transporter [Desulfobacterales bacterium]|nr:DMT family transporter [Desulfobacterales bacterium]
MTPKHPLQSASRRPGNGGAYALLAIAPLCWAGNIVLARGVVEMIPPVSFALWRWTLAFVLLLPFAWGHVRRDWPEAVRHWKIVLFLSVTGITGFNTLLYTAVHTTTAINGALIQTAMPAIIVLICLVAFGERATRIQVFGVGLCMAGATAVVLRGRWATLRQMDFAQGDLIMVVAVVLYAMYSAGLRRRPKIHPLSFMAITFGVGALGLLPLYGWEMSRTPAFVPSFEVVASIFYVAVFPSIVAYFCWNGGIDRLGPNRGGLFINLIPVFASLMAVVWLGESLKLFHLAGMTLIAAGMVLFNRPATGFSKTKVKASPPVPESDRGLEETP